MTIDCFGFLGCTHCRAVFMTAEALGIKLNIKEVDLFKGEHLKPEYAKVNPRRTVPAINDNGFILTESRAIMMYLANAYGKNDSMYPKSAKERAQVDRLLFFDITSLYREFEKAYYPAIFSGQPVNQQAVAKLDEVLGVLDEILDKTTYVAGDSLTIADFSIMSSLSTMEATGVKLSPFQKVFAYYNKLKKEIKNYDEVNDKGAKVFGQFAIDNINAKK